MMTQSINEAYNELLRELHYRGLNEVNARTGVGITMLRGGHSFKLALGWLPVPGNRRYYPRVAAAEVAWQLMGTQDPEFIMAKAPKIWGDFVKHGKLETAYGYRWRRHFGRDQLGLAVDELRHNPTNRQLYVSAWDPATDGLGGPQPKNVPCPVGFGLTRTADWLHCSVVIRSSDVFVGLPYDIMGYALLTDAVAASVGCEPGTLHVTLIHPHYYDTHEKFVELSVNSDHSIWYAGDKPELPGWSVEQIEAEPDQYVEHVKQLSMECGYKEWDPKPELVI